MLRFYLVLIFVACASSTIDKKKLIKDCEADESFIAARETCSKLLSIPIDSNLEVLEADELPENIQCLVKCIQERQGYIDEEGNLVIDKLPELPAFKQMNEEETAKAIDCLKGVDKIVTCVDLKKVKQCFKHVE